MLTFLAYLAVTVVATAVVWKGSSVLERASEQLGRYYGMPPIVQGAVIAAVGSSFPEFSTVVISTLLHGEFELGVAAIVGSAIFNILVIPAVAALAGDGAMDSSKELVYKEAQFYMLAVAGLLLTFSLAVIYYPANGGELSGMFTRGLAIIPLAMYGLYIFIQYEDSNDHETTEPSNVNAAKQWGLLLGSLIVIAVGVEGLVRSAIGFGDIFSTPSFIWGLTIVAAATSIPDMFVSVKASREGSSVASMSNVLGSNVFDLLVVIPVGVLIAGATAVNFARAAPLMGVLVLATVVLFVVTRIDLNITDHEASLLLFLYAAFIAWMVAETLGLSGLVL